MGALSRWRAFSAFRGDEGCGRGVLSVPSVSSVSSVSTGLTRQLQICPDAGVRYTICIYFKSYVIDRLNASMIWIDFIVGREPVVSGTFCSLLSAEITVHCHVNSV